MTTYLMALVSRNTEGGVRVEAAVSIRMIYKRLPRHMSGFVVCNLLEPRSVIFTHRRGDDRSLQGAWSSMSIFVVGFGAAGGLMGPFLEAVKQQKGCQGANA